MSWALPIFERPSIPSFAASRRNLVTVIAPAPVPVPREAPRLRAAAFAPSRPRALRVWAGRLAIVRLARAPACAFLTLRRAVARCLLVAMLGAYPQRRNPFVVMRARRSADRSASSRQRPALADEQRQRGPSPAGRCASRLSLSLALDRLDAAWPACSRPTPV